MVISNAANLIEGEVKVKCTKPDNYDVHLKLVNGEWHLLTTLNKQGAELLLATAPFRTRSNARKFCMKNRRCLNTELELCLNK